MFDRILNDQTLRHVDEQVGLFIQWVNTQDRAWRDLARNDMSVLNAAMNGFMVELPGRGMVVPDLYVGREAALHLYAVASSANYHGSAEIFHDLYDVFCRMIEEKYSCH